MKSLSMIGVVVLTLGFATAAFAGSKGKSPSYCLESTNGSLHNGSGTYLDCRFATKAQCRAARVFGADRCIPNSR